AQATAETVGFLYELVKRMAEKTAIKAYPSVDYQAVFFPVDKHDLSFVKRVLADRDFLFKVENAE
ncbi:DNA-directed RNA polymerase subunit beta, partial [Parabacteroides distasonis]